MESEDQPTANWLIATLSHDARDALLQRAMRIRMRVGDTIAKPHQPIENAWFPESGCISVAAKTAEGQTAEMGAMGWEGFFSVGFLFESPSTSGESTVQIDGEAWVLPRRGFQEWLEAFPEAERLLRSYGNAWMNQVGLHAACNAVHTVDERLVRWILMTHDRTPSDEIHLTHEFLSVMLGVRRASVSVAAARLREAGLIDYTRGHIHVIDRARLELSSCSCYFAVRAAYDTTGVPRLVDHLSSGVRLDS